MDKLRVFKVQGMHFKRDGSSGGFSKISPKLKHLKIFVSICVICNEKKYKRKKIARRKLLDIYISLTFLGP
jgi:hypothetical protein